MSTDTMEATSRIVEDLASTDTGAAPTSARPNHDVPAPKKATDSKRILACGTCRKRKLKCDSKRPKCSTCARLGHPCEYDEVRKKSGPKRGYVKSLEARLNQLESLLDNNRGPAADDEPAPPPLPPHSSSTQPNLSTETRPPQHSTFGAAPASSAPPHNNGTEPEIFPNTVMNDADLNMLSDLGLPVEGFSWDMVSLGLEEPLPSQDVMDDLYQTYFEKIHPSIPMLHRTRFLASLSLGPNSRPPVCLRYIIFAHACSVDLRYNASAEQFYLKARKYIEQDEMRGLGESFTSVAHAQTWSLVATYEFKYMYFPRAWLSVGRAGRLVQLLGLHRQDGVGLEVKQTLPPPRDWIEREERRRTFWVAYSQDRYASIGTGWPMMFDELDILTNLPSSDYAYLNGRPEQTPALETVMVGNGWSSLSALGCVVVLASLFGRNLTHLHRPSTDEHDDDLNGEFWKRHRSLDNILLNISLSLPMNLRLPQGVNDVNIVFCNMNIHTSAICLHQAAIFKADKHKLPAQISAESKRRCLVAAGEITNIMKMISHQDLTRLNPFLAFSLYVAARVFVQYLKFKKEDHTVKMSLKFLLHAMQALKTYNPLTESFLVQLDVDLEGSGIDVPSPMNNLKFSQRPRGESPTNFEAVKCSPLIEIRGAPSYPEQTTRTTPSMAAETPFQYSDSDPTNYFRAPTRPFDSNSGGSFQTGQVLNNGLTPSSASQSDHATPSGLRRASSTATSPQSEAAATSSNNNSSSSNSNNNTSSNSSSNPGNMSTKQRTPHEVDPDSFFLYKSTATIGPGVVPPKFNMEMADDVQSQQQQYQQSNPQSLHRQQTNSSQNNQPESNSPTDFTSMDFSMNMNMNVDGMPSTGFTPGPTGLTPGRYDINSGHFDMSSSTQDTVGMAGFGMSSMDSSGWRPNNGSGSGMDMGMGMGMDSNASHQSNRQEGNDWIYNIHVTDEHLKRG